MESFEIEMPWERLFCVTQVIMNFKMAELGFTFKPNDESDLGFVSEQFFRRNLRDYKSQRGSSSSFLYSRVQNVLRLQKWTKTGGTQP